MFHMNLAHVSHGRFSRFYRQKNPIQNTRGSIDRSMRLSHFDFDAFFDTLRFTFDTSPFDFDTSPFDFDASILRLFEVY